MLDLSQEHLATVLSIIRQRLPAAKIYAFGSRVMGTAKPFSDLDIALDGSVPMSSEQLALLREDLVDSDLPIRVDVVDLAATTTAFRDLITARLNPLA